jgi:hypothetical protein
MKTMLAQQITWFYIYLLCSSDTVYKTVDRSALFLQEASTEQVLRVYLLAQQC